MSATKPKKHQPIFGGFGLIGALTQALVKNLGPVDGLRALSILLVFAFHLLWCAQVVIRDTYAQYQQLPAWLQWFKSGALGVEAFFL